MADYHLDQTHDVHARSFVESAHRPGTDFPIQNLPLCVFRPRGSVQSPRGGTAIGDFILDIAACAPFLEGAARQAAEATEAPTLNALMALSPAHWTALRRGLFSLLLAQGGHRAAVEPLLCHMDAAELFLPVRPGGFVDFFASFHHATNAGRLFRPDAPLLPNYKFVPIGYNGRVSSLRLSGQAVRRPWGQTKAVEAEAPEFAPCAKLDYELELGIFLGGASELGTPVAIGEAGRHVFGLCLLNDWSARDIQAWEYQPLGPFLAKTFATTLSPWIVTVDALRPFRASAAARAPGDPAPLPHLSDAADAASGAFDIALEARLLTPAMAEQGLPAFRLGQANARSLYWTPAQMIAHQTSNGCNLEPGDLYGTGTISGEDETALGSLLEITRNGTQPLHLPSGETRRFLEDGDAVTFHARCMRPGSASIGFGLCTAHVAPALPLHSFSNNGAKP